MPDDTEAGDGPHELLSGEHLEDLSGTALHDLKDTLGEEGDPEARARQRQADGVLVERLRAQGFTGPEYGELAEGLVEYALSVMLSWTATGKIFKKSREVGRPVPTAEVTLDWSPRERGDVALDTVVKGEELFLKYGLVMKRWHPEAGASLRTYFVGAAIGAFRPVYRHWYREREQMRAALREAARGQENENLLAMVPDPRGADGFDQAEFWAQFTQVNIPDPTTRDGLYWYAIGYTQDEAAAKVGLTGRALEGRIRRLRQQANRGPGEGER